MNMMQYKGYAAKIEYDDGDALFYGDVLDLKDTIVFSGASVTELRASFERAVDEYIAWCDERGEQPAKPFSGKVHLRMSPELHRAATLAAAATNESLNTFIVQCVGDALALGRQAKEPIRITLDQDDRDTAQQRPLPVTLRSARQGGRVLIGSRRDARIDLTRDSDPVFMVEGGREHGKREQVPRAVAA